eukprot:7272917-Alexandrium_andersonii.AAC.1
MAGMRGARRRSAGRTAGPSTIRGTSFPRAHPVPSGRRSSSGGARWPRVQACRPTTSARRTVGISTT